MENYQQKLNEYINKMSGKEALALHSCCGPCSSYCISYLADYFDITLYYYNPNIYPEEEYRRRLTTQLKLCNILGVKYAECEYKPYIFDEYVKGFEKEKEGGKRCEKCFEMRLDYTAAAAKQDGIKLFTTTLTVSPHKNAQVINKIGEAIAEKYNMFWLPSDFKKNDGYKKSIELSKEYDLYRQNYCGCRYSVRD